VLVDLMGYTHGMRTGVLAHRPAPVQLAFKGYMSTCGAEYVPLLVSDRVSVPPELATFYAEKQAHPRPPESGGGARLRGGARIAPYQHPGAARAAPEAKRGQVLLSPVFAASTHAVNHPEALAGPPAPRADARLPEGKLVLCCFNSAYKIAPTVCRPPRPLRAGARAPALRTAHDPLPTCITP
jgi:hypothetical protein